MKLWRRSATGSAQGATSSTHSGRAEITSIGSAAAPALRQHFLHDLDDRARREGLDDEAIGLAANGLEHRRRRLVGGHDDHAGRTLDRPRAGEHLEPAHPGQPDVEQHHVGRLFRERAHGARAVALLPHGVAGLGQERTERMSQRPIIVDDKDVARCSGEWSHRIASRWNGCVGEHI